MGLQLLDGGVGADEQGLPGWSADNQLCQVWGNTVLLPHQTQVSGTLHQTSVFNSLPGAVSEKSSRGRGQNIPKHPVAVGKLCYFHTWKFPYNLMRISWMITVRDFLYFPRAILHCLCIRSESERVFESQVEETCCWFSRRISSMSQTMMNDSLAFALKILCFEKL